MLVDGKPAGIVTESQDDFLKRAFGPNGEINRMYEGEVKKRLDANGNDPWAIPSGQRSAASVGAELNAPTRPE
jgi:hypothetical protein